MYEKRISSPATGVQLPGLIERWLQPEHNRRIRRRDQWCVASTVRALPSAAAAAAKWSVNMLDTLVFHQTLSSTTAGSWRAGFPATPAGLSIDRGVMLRNDDPNREL